MIKVIKRDGRRVTFHPAKISDALLKAAEGTASKISLAELKEVKEYILEILEKDNVDELTVEHIQDTV
ncbi:MAG: hypothetical protein LBG49_03415, partial [Mycoplasmataceae bacterium]|nr:hypothetical protein [Mycoplasmataceae bacterium]